MEKQPHWNLKLTTVLDGKFRKCKIGRRNLIPGQLESRLFLLFTGLRENVILL